MAKKPSFKKSVDKKQTKQIKQLQKEVKELQEPIERKFLDTVFSQQLKVTDIANGLVSQKVLNNVLPAGFTGGSTGNQDILSQRVGKNITMDSLHIRGSIFYNPDNLVNPGANAKVRILIVCYPQYLGNAGGSDIGNVLTPASAITNQDCWVNAHYNRFPKSEYTVLYDKTYMLQNQTSEIDSVSTSQNIPVYPNRKFLIIKEKIKGAMRKAEWGTLESISNPNRSVIVMYAIPDITDAQSSVNETPKVNFNCRLHYLDA